MIFATRAQSRAFEEMDKLVIDAKLAEDVSVLHNHIGRVVAWEKLASKSDGARGMVLVQSATLARFE